MVENITTIKDYLEKAKQTKIVTCPSGAIFKIKKPNLRTAMFEGKVPVSSAKDIISTPKNEEEKKILKEKLERDWANATDEQRRKKGEYFNQIILDGVDSPKISIDEKDGYLWITDIVDDDFFFLITEISNLKSEGDRNLKTFRTEKDTDNAGQDSGKVQDTTVGTSQP